MKESGRMRNSFAYMIVAVSVVLSIGTNTKADFTFGELKNLGPGVNGPGFESAAGISVDGLSFYFLRPDLGQLWVSTRATKDAPWGDALYLGLLTPSDISTTTSSIGFLATVTTADGLEAYYSAQLSGGFGRKDIWGMMRETLDDVWGSLLNLGPVVNSQYDENLACVSPDGLELFFSGRLKEGVRPGGYGYADLWVTRRTSRNAPWTEPVNLGAVVNSAYTDGRPSISPDGLVLFFDSNRPGGFGNLDLYMTRRMTLSDPWGSPVNLGPLVNTNDIEECARISADGSTLYWDSDRPGGYGDNDMWQVSILPKVDFNSDNRMDAKDISILVDHWHTSDPLCDIGPTPMGDGIVDIQDLIALSEYLEPGFGRIAHWKLDEKDGDIASDSVGPYHADVIGEALWQPESGILDGALQLDGVESYLAPALVLDPQDGPFRITAWVQGGAPGQVIASQLPEGDTNTELLYLAADSEDGTLITSMVLPNMPLDSGIVITDGQWHEVGFEWDGDYRHLTVDGVEVVDELTLPVHVFDQSGWLDIGKGKESHADTYWSGLIDDVKVFKKGSKP